MGLYYLVNWNGAPYLKKKKDQMMFQVHGNYTLLTPAQLCNVSLDYDKLAHMSFVNLETAYDGDMVVH